MSIIGRARQLEGILARSIDDAAQKVTQPHPLEPLEIVHAILDVVEDEVLPAGRGTYVFPFNRIEIAVVTLSSADRARHEAVFDEAPRLGERIVERLRAVQCEVTGLSVDIAYVSAAASHWSNPHFHVEFARVARVEPVGVPVQVPSRIDLAIVCGTAESAAYSFTQTRIDLGRCAQVRDSRHRLFRTNHVAFADVDAGVNASVSRCHAHVEYDGESGDYRLHDDRSAHGTGVLRHGRTLAVAPGSRGVRLQTGDEIVLGEARLRVTLGVDRAT
jgi:FHA domain